MGDEHKLEPVVLSGGPVSGVVHILTNETDLIIVPGIQWPAFYNHNYRLTNRTTKAGRRVFRYVGAEVVTNG